MMRTLASIATVVLLTVAITLVAGLQQRSSGLSDEYPGGAERAEAAERDEGSAEAERDPLAGASVALEELPRAITRRVRTGRAAGDEALEILVGPLDLPRDLHHLRLPIRLATIDVEGWMHGFSWSLSDGDGEDLPDELLHHVNLIDPDRRELFAAVPRRVMAAGRETRSPMLPRVVGYPLEPGTRLLVAAMFANPTDRGFEDVYLRLRLRYTAAGRELVRPRDVFPFHIDVMGPLGDKDFTVPPGRTVRSWEGSPAIDGRILGLSGHMHDYATRLRLEDVTTGRVLWESEPYADRDGRVYSVPTALFWKNGGIPVRRDHTYRVTVVYDNPLDRPAPDGGMGVIGGVVLASDDARWPETDPDHPDFRSDLVTTLEKPFADDGHGGHGSGGELDGHGGPGAGGGDAETEGREEMDGHAMHGGPGDH